MANSQNEPQSEKKGIFSNIVGVARSVFTGNRPNVDADNLSHASKKISKKEVAARGIGAAILSGVPGTIAGLENVNDDALKAMNNGNRIEVAQQQDDEEDPERIAAVGTQPADSVRESNVESVNGMKFIVEQPIRMRSQATTSATVLSEAIPVGTYDVISGPVNSDGFDWFQYTANGLTGWSAVLSGSSKVEELIVANSNNEENVESVVDSNLEVNTNTIVEREGLSFTNIDTVNTDIGNFELNIESDWSSVHQNTIEPLNETRFEDVEKGVATFWALALSNMPVDRLPQELADEFGQQLTFEEALEVLKDREKYPNLLLPMRVINDYTMLNRMRIEDIPGLESYAESTDPNVYSDVFVNPRLGISIDFLSQVTAADLKGPQDGGNGRYVWLSLQTSSGVNEPQSGFGYSVESNGKLHLVVFNRGNDVSSASEEDKGYNAENFNVGMFFAMSRAVESMIGGVKTRPVNDVSKNIRFYWEISEAFGSYKNKDDMWSRWLQVEPLIQVN